jgi:hypothetical protein
MFGANYAPMLHRHKHCLQMDRNKIPQDPQHLVVPSGASKMISKPMVRSAQTMHLSCVRLALSLNELNQASTWALSIRSTIGCVQNDFWAYGMYGTNQAPILHLHQYCLQMDQNEIPHDPRHLRVPSGASKTISKVVVRSTQIVYLSCVKISTIFEMTESSFQLSLVTWEYNQERPKRFLSLRYIWCKPCTYHAQTVTLSLNGLKRDSTWPMPPWNSIGCVQNIFWGRGMFSTNCAVSFVKISIISGQTESSLHLSLIT